MKDFETADSVNNYYKSAGSEAVADNHLHGLQTDDVVTPLQHLSLRKVKLIIRMIDSNKSCTFK